MVAEVVVVTAGEERKEEPPPEFAQIARNIMAQLANGIGQQRVGAWIAWGESQQAGTGNKRNAARAGPIKAGDDRRAVPAHGHQLVLDNADAGFRSQCERQHFAAGNVPGVDRKSTRLNSSHLGISYAVFCLKK